MNSRQRRQQYVVARNTYFAAIAFIVLMVLVTIALFVFKTPPHE